MKRRFVCLGCGRKTAPAQGERCLDCRVRVRIAEGKAWSAQVDADPLYASRAHKGANGKPDGIQYGRHS